MIPDFAVGRGVLSSPLFHPFRGWPLALLALTLCLPAQVLAQGTGGGVAARLRVGNKTLDVILLTIQAEKLQYSNEDDRRVAQTVKIADVQSAYFKLDHDRTAVATAAAKRDWNTAGSILYNTYRVTFPFLSLPENNAAPVLLQAGTYLIRAATIKGRCGTTSADRLLAEQDYKAASYVLNQVAAAAWYEDADSAEAKNVLCLIQLGRPDEAQRVLDSLGEPERTDSSYGLYWLARAQFAYAKGDTRAALGDVVESILAETKDLDCFPEALLLSARCYDSLQEPYRARDTYYELARLFTGTPWGEFARGRLQNIMTTGVTRDTEPVPIASVFLASEEDVNAKVEQLLGLGKGSGKTPGPDKSGRKDVKVDSTPQGKPEEKKDK